MSQSQSFFPTAPQGYDRTTWQAILEIAQARLSALESAANDSAYVLTNHDESDNVRAIDPTTITHGDLAIVVATLLLDLKTKGVIA